MIQSVQNALPRWRGFNLLYFFHGKSDCTPLEADFRWIADWGFDFVRLPMCYILWTEAEDPYKIKESVLERIDATVEMGKKYGIHTSLNFHRAPGYSVNREREEPFDLWKDQAALDAFCFHWELFARRYKGISSEALSFDLVNEPPRPSDEGMTRADHERVVRTVTGRIREVDPERLVIADGLSVGNDPIPELTDLGIAQSCRGYKPVGISHYKAGWVDSGPFPEPVWPGGDDRGERWDRQRLEAYYTPWAKLVRQGVGVHCGECGGYNQTPHDVFLAWFRDLLEILTANGIGFALWNFRGSFGILDSGRKDVSYEDWHGHRLDGRLLELLQMGAF